MSDGINIFVAIAVSAPEKLDPLPGAITAAHDLIAWADATKEYRTLLITDEQKPDGSDNPVTLERLSREIEPLINKGDEERDRIVITFAGHGLFNGGDLWLLNKWDSKEDVVDVQRLQLNLATYQPKQITILSDACRSPPSPDAPDVRGHRVFTKMDWKPSRPDLDLLLAAGLGQPAYMVRGKDDQKPYCLFSHVVTNGLWGRYPVGVDEFQHGMVTSQSLKKAIDQELPAAANALNQSQQADIRVTFMRPRNVYMTLVDPPAAVQALDPPSPDEPDILLADDNDFLRLPDNRDFVVGFNLGDEPAFNRRIRRRPPPAPKPTDAELRRSFAQRFVDDLRGEAQERPTHFETETGVAAVGALVRDVAVGPQGHAQLDMSPQAPADSRGRWWLLNGPPGSMAAQLLGGDWVGAALFPGKIGTFSIDRRGASALVYRRGRLPQDWEAETDAAASAAAEEAIAEMHAGSLTGEPARNLAAHIRQWKHADPVLGVIAAYLYARLNDIESIQRLAWFYPVNNQPIPFDVALLGELPLRRAGGGLLFADIPKTSEREAQAEREEEFDFTTQPTPGWKDAPVAGGFPWLRRGWDLLDDIDAKAFKPLIELTDGLTPALFTTLRADDGARLAKLIREGTI